MPPEEQCPDHDERVGSRDHRVHERLILQGDNVQATAMTSDQAQRVGVTVTRSVQVAGRAVPDARAHKDLRR